MKPPQRLLFIVLSSFVLCFVAFRPANAPAVPAGQQSSTPTSPAVIKAQADLVLVDAVVTDKHGNYVRDLGAKDFKVYEDGKEQKIASVSRGEETHGPAGPAEQRHGEAANGLAGSAEQHDRQEANGPASPAQKHYIVLFFDNSPMGLGDLVFIRRAAAKFIDKYAGPDHPMAVEGFNGILRIWQNFTADADQLRAVVSQSTSPRTWDNCGSTGHY